MREQEIYAREGLDTREIVFRDNQGLIDLISKSLWASCPFAKSTS